jgi:hypothetical protein
VGDATPLFYRLDRIAYHTTWDRGPLSRLLREHAGDQALSDEAVVAALTAHARLVRAYPPEGDWIIAVFALGADS